MMVDFNEGQEVLNRFLGSEKKTTVLYRGTVYMLKFPDPIRESKNSLSYMNNQFSEYMGCKVFESCGFDVQQTMLGYYTDKKGQKKIVVGCEDFTQSGAILHEFSKLDNAVIEVDAKSNLSIESVHQIIEQNHLIMDKESIKQRFWDMFVVDTLIGNGDRHFDNFGLLSQGEEIRFAPVYDCGSSLGALLSDERMAELLHDPVLLKNQEYNVKSCFYFREKRVFYHEIFRNPPQELQDALRRMIPKIDTKQIALLIKGTEGISHVRREYLITSVEMRFREILVPAHKRI